MFTEEFNAVANAAISKLKLLKNNPIGYFLLSMLAGAFIGFGVILAFTGGGFLNGAPYTKLAMGLSFGIALSLVVFSGGELFTGNNLVMTAGMLKKKVTLNDSIKLWIICYLGNFAGAILLGIIYHLTGLGNSLAGEFMASGAMAKTSVTAIQLLARGILCNTLVCIAVWCSFKCKSDSGKLIMIFWCLFAFITSGFEHSIANMTLFTIAFLNPCGQALTIGGVFFNLLFVTIGNMIGGILCIAVPYYVASKE